MNDPQGKATFVFSANWLVEGALDLDLNFQPNVPTQQLPILFPYLSSWTTLIGVMWVP